MAGDFAPLGTFVAAEEITRRKEQQLLRRTIQVARERIGQEEERHQRSFNLRVQDIYRRKVTPVVRVLQRQDNEIARFNKRAQEITRKRLSEMTAEEAGAALGPEAAVAGAGLAARQRPQVQVPTIRMQPRQLPAMPRSLLDIYTPEELAAKQQAAAGPAPGPGELFRRPIEAVEAVSREVLPRVIGPETRIQVGPVELGGIKGREYAPYPETAEALEKPDYLRRYIGKPVARGILEGAAQLAIVGEAIAPARLPFVPSIRGITRPPFTPGELRGPIAVEVASYITDPLNVAVFPGATVKAAQALLRGARLTAAESRLLQEAVPTARRLLAGGEAGLLRVGSVPERQAELGILISETEKTIASKLAKGPEKAAAREIRMSAYAERGILDDLEASRAAGLSDAEILSRMEDELRALGDTMVGRGFAGMKRPTDETLLIRARMDTLGRFVDMGRLPEAAVVPEVPTVGRLRMTETGELVPESTFATERELAGLRETQAPLGIGAGERPIEELPMFRAAPAPAREAVGAARVPGKAAADLEAERAAVQRVRNEYAPRLQAVFEADDTRAIEALQNEARAAEDAVSPTMKLAHELDAERERLVGLLAEERNPAAATRLDNKINAVDSTRWSLRAKTDYIVGLNDELPTPAPAREAARGIVPEEVTRGPGIAPAADLGKPSVIAEPGVAAVRGVPRPGEVPPGGVGGPPRTPPPSPPTGRPPVGGLPERGYGGAQELLDTKEAALLRSGRLMRLPGIKQVASKLFPSVEMDRKVLVSYNARGAARASLETEFSTLRRSPLDELKAVWKSDPPAYVGPADNPFKNTLKDWGDNPEFYALTPRHKAVAAAYNTTSDQTLARARGDFGVDINPFPVKEGGFYVPTVATRESLDPALQKVADSYTSAGISGRGTRAKTRLYEGAYQRWKRNPDFQAETNIDELTALHDKALATMAGNETFRLGAGGKTRLEVMAETHPALYEKMMGLRRKMAALRDAKSGLSEDITQALDNFERAGGETEALNQLMTDLQVKPGVNMRVIAADRDNIGRVLNVSEDGKTATVHFRNRQTGARATKSMPTSQLTPLYAGAPTGTKLNVALRQIQSQIREVRQGIHDLQPAWKGASTEPYVFNQKTYRYHLPEQSTAINGILQTNLPVGDGVLDIVDEIRLTNLAGDISLLPIQGGLGVLSNPVTGVYHLPGALRSLVDPDTLARIAAKEPDMVRRFTIATGTPFGEVSAEFIQRTKGLERIPGVGRFIGEPTFRFVTYVRYQQWKTDVAILRTLNPKMSQVVADAEAANALSKVIPMLSPAERGRSVLGAKLERAPIISSSFVGAPIGLVKDATSGLAKLTVSKALSPAARWQSLSGREQLALLNITGLVGSLSTISAGTYILAGHSPEEAAKTVLNPLHPRFWSVTVGDRYIPIGGPIRSFVKSVLWPQKVGEIKGVPIYAPFTRAPQWIQGKVTPALRAPSDLYRNADWRGGKIVTGSFPENVLRGIWYGVNSVIPLAAAVPSEAVRTGEVAISNVGELATRALGQLGGLDIRRASPFQQFNEVYRQAFGVDYIGEPGQALEASQNPRTAPLYEKWRQSQVQRGVPSAIQAEERQGFLTDQEKQLSLGYLAQQFQAGNENAGPAIIKTYSQFKEAAGIAAAYDYFGTDDWDARTPEGQAVQAFQRVGSPYSQEWLDPETLQPDWDRWNAARDAAFKATPSGYQQAYDARLRTQDPDFRRVEPQVKQAEKLRDQYYDLPKWKGISKTNEERLLEFQRQVEDERVRLAEQGYADTDIKRLYAVLGARLDDPVLAQAAYNLRPNSKRSQDLKNPNRVTFLLDNYDALYPFFPEIYTRDVIAVAGRRRSAVGE